MTRSEVCIGEKATWRGREAYLLANDVLRLVVLTGGGHIAELRFRDGLGFSTLNPLWIPPWKTMEPYDYRPSVHASRYGPLREGKLLCGIVGHNLCLDYFGPPSDEEAAQGLSFHGEAPNLRWKKRGLRKGGSRAALVLNVKLPVAELNFVRQITLRRGESVAYFQERVTNLRKADHFFQWTQHVTLGPPFLSHRHSLISVSATKGKTDPHPYDERRSLLAPGREFRWPLAPTLSGRFVDLTRPLPQKGRGLVTGLLLDPHREIEFVAAVNFRERLMIAYCFRRRDFPWMALWDEDRAIAAAPWKTRTQSLGLEFGATPLPLPRRESFALGPLFGTPTLAHLPARGQRTVRYLAFLAHLPPLFRNVRDIRVEQEAILVRGAGRKELVRVRAQDAGRTLLAG